MLEDENRKRKFIFYVKHYMHKVGRWQNFILQMREKIRDYTSMASLSYTCWHALKDMCDAYDNRLIFK